MNIIIIFLHHEFYDIDPKMFVHHCVQSSAGVAKKLQHAWIRCIYHKFYVILWGVRAIARLATLKNETKERLHTDT